MSKIATVTESVKESLIGVEQDTTQLSIQAKATFDTYAKKDESTGELVMGEEEFISAIAPEHEDYVSHRIENYSSSYH